MEEKHGHHLGVVTHHELKQSLTTLQLWAIAVGLVISGEYFGWSYGWASAGTLGFTITALFVAAMYTTFIFSFTELTTSIPHAGGPFAYARHAFGPSGGYFAGAATLVEFVFAPPAIALAIGAYLNVQFPGLDPKLAAVGAYLVFMLLNILGVAIAATFELIVTILAIFELLVFMGVVSPGFSIANFVKGGWSGADHFSFASFAGMFAAIPFAIWFFLAIEGVAMAAEEAKDPKRSIPIAYIAGILTLLALAVGVMLFAGAAGDWTKLSNINDPLPQAMKFIVGEKSGWLHMLVALGLFGLVASFHGIILGYSRQIFALARAGYLPRSLAAVHPRFETSLGCNSCRRRHRHPRHFQRQSHRDRRPAADRQYRHNVGFRRDPDVRDQHGEPVQAAPERAEDGASVPGPRLSALPRFRAVCGDDLHDRDGLL